MSPRSDADGDDAADGEPRAPGPSADDAREEITEALRSLSLEGSRPVQRLRLWWLLLAGVVAGLVLVFQGEVRLGGYVLASAFGGAALLRLVLPTWMTGGLVTRSRLLDAATMLALAAATAVLTSALNLTAAG